MNPRRPSNKIKQQQLETKFLEQQTKKMEERLSELKKQVQQQKQLKATTNFQTTVTRWKKNTRSDAPLKSYAKQILQQQKQAYKKFGIDEKKITGTKTFVKIKKQIKDEKQQEQQKKPTKIPLLMSKSNSLRQKQPRQIPVQTLENNFFKAKMDIKNLIKEKTVLQFLEEIFLQQYYPLFQSNSITELGDLRFVSRQQLEQMQIPKGHQIKIMKKIKQEFDKSKSPAKFQSAEKTFQSKDIVKDEPKKGELVEMGYGDGDINEYERIQSEELRNKLEQNFQEEVESENQQEEQLRQEQNDVVLITVPLSEIALQTGEQEQQQMDEMARSIVQNCFNCYKSIPLKNDVYRSPDSRNFCSSNCLRMYEIQMQKTCPQCNKKFFKTAGYYEEGLWFCSIECCPNKQDIEEMFLEWAKKEKEGKK